MIILNSGASKAYEVITDYGATVAAFVLFVMLLIKLIGILKSGAQRKLKLQNVLNRSAAAIDVPESEDDFIFLEEKTENNQSYPRRNNCPPLVFSAITVLAAERLIDEYIEKENALLNKDSIKAENTLANKNYIKTENTLVNKDYKITENMLANKNYIKTENILSQKGYSSSEVSSRFSNEDADSIQSSAIQAGIQNQSTQKATRETQNQDMQAVNLDSKNDRYLPRFKPFTRRLRRLSQQVAGYVPLGLNQNMQQTTQAKGATMQQKSDRYKIEAAALIKRAIQKTRMHED